MSTARPMGNRPFPAVSFPLEVDCRVKSNERVNEDYRLLKLAAPRSILNCEPGQFFHLLCPVVDGLEPYLRRPMSIYGFYPETEELHFLYKVTGTGTAALARLKRGESLSVFGPLGKGFTIEDDWKNLVLVARGVGLATLAPLALKARSLNKNLTAICSARSQAVLMSQNYFLKLGARVIALTDDAGTSHMSHLENILAEIIAESGIDALYTCGSNRILKTLQKVGKRHGIPGEIALEQQMACGIGMCQCCVRAFSRGGALVNERVCKEGPVFDLQEAIGC